MPIDFASFRGRELGALASVGIDSRPRTNKPCPACGGTDRFTLYRDGRHFCRQCGTGDFLDLIQKVHRCSFLDALKMADGGRHCSPAPNEINPSKDDGARKRERVKSIIAGAHAIVPGDDVFQYLTIERGFPADILPAELLSHPGLEYWHEVNPGKWESLGSFPAMVAPVKDVSGEVVAVHVTYLLDGKKAPVPSPKKLIGSPKGGAVRLYPAGDEVGIAEGIETAIAASDIFDKPVWASLSASLMPSVEIPDDARLVWIFADNDEAGIRAAVKLASTLSQKNKRTKAPITPVLSGSDFYDSWRNQSEQFKYISKP